MLFWQPIMQRRRQEQRLVHIRGSKALSHGRILTPYTLWKSCYVWCFCRIYSRHTPSSRVSRTAASQVPIEGDFASIESLELDVAFGSLTRTEPSPDTSQKQWNPQALPSTRPRYWLIRHCWARSRREIACSPQTKRLRR